ncbi:ClpP family protease [Thermoflexus sp.]|uniref:ClpP family protease n=1 Tax=Thermoflexus sp. TaxID=1969742 RepID=UPI0035E44A97
MANLPIVIRFFAPVIDSTINALLNTIDQKMREGHRDFMLLLSSPGGSVFHGLSAYNYLKGIPVRITTCNFGSVDSIGVVLYCAGTRRLSVPHARFMLHGVSAQFPQPMSLEEKQLEERLKGLRIDLENIAKVIATSIGKSVGEVIEAMHDRITLNPEEARAWGLVHEIVEGLFPAGAEVIAIQYQEPLRPG